MRVMTQKSLDYLQNNPAVSEFIKKVNTDIDVYYTQNLISLTPRQVQPVGDSSVELMVI